MPMPPALRRLAALLIASTASAAADAAAQPVPAAADVVAKYVTAIGGDAAVRAITSLRQVGTMAMPAMGLTGETEVLYLAPNRSSTRVAISGLGEIIAGTDGEVAWSINPMQGPRLLTDQELATAKEGADLLGQLLFAADRFRRIETIGRTEFGGEPTWKLTFVSRESGSITHRYFSIASGLLRGAETTTSTAMGTITSVLTLSDYQTFGALRFPTRSETAIGPQVMVMTTTGVEYNRLPATAITIPDVIKPLVKK